jgi:hypothetical protein
MTGIYDILTQIGYTNLVDHGKEYRTSPLYRQSGNLTSLSINKQTGEWYDYSARVGGRIQTLVEMTINGPLSEEIKAKLLAGEFKVNPVVELDHIKTFDKKLLLKLIKDHDYWLNRGVSRRTIEKFEGGTTFNGRMANRYVFPIFNEKDELVGFSGRLIADKKYAPKWKHIGAKNTWCYPLKVNKDTIFAKREIIIVESIGDMLAIFEAGIENVAVAFGVSISANLVKFLLKADIQKIYIAFNNDRENNLVGNISAKEEGEKLQAYFDASQIQIALPSDKNDFGEMSSEEINIWKQANQIQ